MVSGNSKVNIFRHYALWLEPEAAQARAALEGLISTLASRYGGPRFPPHLTVYGSIYAQTPEEAASLALSLAPHLPEAFRITLGKIEGCQEYFRCLYALAEGGDALHGAHAHAKEAFAPLIKNDGWNFMPHVSLCYGHLSPEEKQKVTSEIAPLLPLSFEARGLYLYDVEGPTEDWKLACRILPK